jgi:LPS-assembly protein
MLKFSRLGAAVAAGVLATPLVAAAQIPGFGTIAQSCERLADRWKCVGEVELAQGTMKFYADEVEYFSDTDRLIASGNVLLTEVDHLIAADRADFNAKTRLGTFFNARGFATLGPKTDISTYGTLDPDVQFYGDTVEKTGPDTYVITGGGFTTCAQATPRWEMTSSSLKLRLDHYALLRNMMLKVKGVPALYLPAMYYPLSKDNRSTGFLMPSYGTSTYKGQVISNAFFWAINRSQDATILHDWFSKTGQAIAGEYRYVSLGGSGNLRTDFINEHEITLAGAEDETETLPGLQSFRLNGSLNQNLGAGWYAQGRADYSSNLTVDQRYSTDIAQATQRNRTLGGSVSGSLRGYRITGTYDRNEVFNGISSSWLRGYSPRVNVSRPERTIGRLPVYASINTDYVHLVRRGYGDDHVQTSKEDIDRIDVVPVLRFPYTKLPFLALNTSLTWRNTFWSDSRSLLPGGEEGPRIGSAVSRRFFEMSASANGPTLVRIWDSPNTRFKHSIEPFVTVSYRTPIDNHNQIFKFDGPDYIVGNATSSDYGVNTRFYSKRTADGPAATPRELVTATIRQTYYSDARSILSDQQVRASNQEPPTHFSPVSMIVRTSPLTGVNGSFRTDFDGRYSKFRNFGADGSWENQAVSLVAGWSQVRFYPDATGKNIARFSHFFNSNTTVRFMRNRFGVIHNFNWDIENQSVLQQRIAGYYNAQCCGFSAEYQTFDLSRVATRSLIPQESRFHFSVTLAGIGNVSNIFGALGGTPNR